MTQEKKKRRSRPLVLRQEIAMPKEIRPTGNYCYRPVYFEMISRVSGNRVGVAGFAWEVGIARYVMADGTSFAADLAPAHWTMIRKAIGMNGQEGQWHSPKIERGGAVPDVVLEIVVGPDVFPGVTGRWIESDTKVGPNPADLIERRLVELHLTEW